MILCDAPHKRIMFLSVSSSRIGTRFLFIDSKSWRRFERRRKILSRHSEKWKMDRFLHVEERGKNFPSRIDCFPRGESSASARVVDSKIFFLKTVWLTKLADVYRTVDITETPETKEFVFVFVFFFFFSSIVMVKIFFLVIFSRSVFQNTWHEIS